MSLRTQVLFILIFKEGIKMNNLREITIEILTNGGATYNIGTGEFNPKTGYMVSLKGHERVFKLPLTVDEIEEHVKQFILDFSTCLANENNYFGAWLFENKLYLDVSKKVNTGIEAYKLCIKNDQLAYFDNYTRQTVLKDAAIPLEVLPVETLEDIERAILKGFKSVEYNGKVFQLPSLQKSGTLTQNRAYVYTKAKEIYFS